MKRRVGLVSASAGLYQGLSVREMLLFFADLYGVSPSDAHAELEKLSSLLGLGEFIDQRCATLSTGQRQRVNLARSLIHRPPVMLLDEPTLGLDVLASQIVTEYIDHLRPGGQGRHFHDALSRRRRTTMLAIRPFTQGPACQRGHAGITARRDRLHLAHGDVPQAVPYRPGSRVEWHACRRLGLLGRAIRAGSVSDGLEQTVAYAAGSECLATIRDFIESSSAVAAGSIRCFCGLSIYRCALAGNPGKERARIDQSARFPKPLLKEIR